MENLAPIAVPNDIPTKKSLDDGLALKLDKTGGTLTGSTYISTAAGAVANFGTKSGGLLRWAFGKSNLAESGADAGSDFNISRWDDAGNWLGNALTIVRKTGNAIFEGDLQAAYGIFTYGADMGGFKITGLANGTAASDAVSKAQLDLKLDKTGGTISGDAAISKAVGVAANLAFQTAGLTRWALGRGPTAESGGNAGSDFILSRWDDSGAWLGNVISILRSTGDATFSGDVAAEFIVGRFGGNFGGYKLSGVANGTIASDAVNKGQLDTVDANVPTQKVVSGLWTPAFSASHGSPTVALTMGYIFATRCFLWQASDQVQFELTTGAALTYIRVLAYADTPTGPGALLATGTADVTASGTGLKTATIALPAGYFWIALFNIMGDGTNVNLRASITDNPLLPGSGGIIAATSITPSAWIKNVGTAVSPNPWGTTTSRDKAMPIVYARAV